MTSCFLEGCSVNLIEPFSNCLNDYEFIKKLLFIFKKLHGQLQIFITLRFVV